jgi:hypothetical protein
MAAQLVALRIDALDPAALARFWATALGWDVRGDELVPTDGTRFGVRFVRTTEAKSTKNVVHLDLTTTSQADQDRSVETLLAVGASHADVGQRGDEGHVVLVDPEGNELCIIEPGNSFLAGCGRFGSITCDGSPAVGRFWSQALGWPLVWDQDEETAIRHPDGTGPFITWGPPVPPPGTRNRFRLELAAVGVGVGVDVAAEVDRLVALGASLVDDRTGVLADPDGLEFLVVPDGGR